MLFVIIGQLLCGWLIADFLSGLVHWWEDRVAREDWPLIGPWVVAPNRLHHRDAMAFLKKPIFVRNWTALPLTVVMVALWWWLLGPSLVLAATAVGTAIAVEVHYQSHLPHTPFWLRSILRPLWDIGLIQSPREHNRHHEWPDGDYCALTGWLNPILEHFRFWNLLEGGLTVIGLEPNKGLA